jgi:3-hydroxybutyryl-CoA dehydrogenase
MRRVDRVLVVGAGVMGHGFAQIFALNALNVTLVDRTEDILKRAKAGIQANLQSMVELGELDSRSVPEILDRIHCDTDLQRSAGQADYVLEAVSEDLDLKKRVFEQLGNAAGGDVVLATNTSSFDINALSAVTRYPQRVIGTHWFHPPQITPCVEVIPAEATSREVMEFTITFMKALGKFPTLCKSAPGFVANRIQMAMAAEALAIVEEGLATPKEVDRIVTSSFAFRLSAYGPFEICDQAGLDTYQAIYSYLHEKLGREQFSPPKILERYIQQGRLGLKSQAGFYEYAEGAAETLKKDRDRKFYARLKLFQKEQQSRHTG